MREVSTETGAVEHGGKAEPVGDVVVTPAVQVKGVTVFMWANFGLLVTVLFFSGIFYQRVVEVEARVKALQNIDTLIAQVTDLKAELNRVRDRLDKLLDERQRERDGR